MTTRINKSPAVEGRTFFIRRATAEDTENIKHLIITSSIHAAGLSVKRLAMPQPSGAATQRQSLIRRMLLKLFACLITSPFDWRNYAVAVLQDGTVIGCYQVKIHRGGIREAATLAIDSEWRNGIIARRLMKFVYTNTPRPIWGTCMTNLVPLHKRYGGIEVFDSRRMPPYLRRRRTLFNFFYRLARKKDRLTVMELE